MSLHKFAEQVAQHGRGDDSLLVHMTPDEVQRLQAFAEANGTTMTINPDTGLPEAGFLSDLFKSVAPIALGAFLGPAGLAFGGGMMSAGMAGLTVGGLTTLATGSLSRGLMAGLGAYGGAGLGESLMGAGTGALEAGAASAAQGQLGAANLALGEAMPAQAAEQFTKDAVARQMAGATTFDKMGAGLGAITSSPSAAGTFAKDNWKTLAAAATPIMAGAMVPTTTKMPAETNPAYIRQKLYDPYTQTYKTLAPVKASEWGNRSFSDAYTNPQTGQMATLDQRQPTPMAGGGIVALAAGGPPTVLSDEALYQKTGSWEAAAAARDAQNNALNAYNWQQQAAAQQPTGSAAAQYAAANNIDINSNINNWIASNPNADRTSIDAAMNKYGISQADVNRALSASTVTSPAVDYALSHGMGLSDINQNIANFTNAAATKNATDAQIDAAMKQYGLSNEDIARALAATGGSQAEQYALLAGNMGLSGLNTNINDWIAKARLDPTFKAKTGLQQQQAALDAMGTVNMNEADVLRATGKTIAQLFPSTLTKPIEVVPGGTQLDTATTYGNGAYGNYGSGPATGVDYLGRTVSIATPGDIITNPDGSRTVVPNLPGRPYGGYTGMDQVKSAYTAGGGSLGYTAKAPKTIEEFNQLYNKQTGDSAAAYDYLIGKGAGTAGAAKYPVQSTAAATGINRPYWSEGMRFKPKFLSYDKEGNVVSSATSKTGSGDKTTGTAAAGTTAVVGGSNYDLTDSTKQPPEDNNGPWSWDVSVKKWVQYGRYADGGMTGYAMGGGLGTLGSYSDGGRLLKGPGDGVSDSIPATIGTKGQPARLADGEFVVPARIVSELGNGSTEAGAKKLYAMMDRVQKARGKTTGKNKVAANSRADKYLPA